MKHFLTAGAGLLAFTLVSQSAHAADIPVAPPVSKGAFVAPVFDWTGCYAGVHAGYGWGRKSWTVVDTIFLGRHRVDGWLAGGQIGCDYQTGPWVFGAEADFSWSGIDGSTTNVELGAPNRIDVDIDWLASATVRAGYAQDRSLLYLKGGAAWVRDKFVDRFAAPPFATGAATKSGWTIGGGYEYAFAPNWSGKIEYAYYDFGTISKVFNSGDNYDIKQHMHTVKFGINYRFATGKMPAPIVTRY